MKEFNDYSNSELISLLVDSQLDKSQEDLLYRNISSDTEMQEELQELLAIRESVKKDKEAFSPPAELTNNVFAALGYSSPYGTAPVDAVPVSKPEKQKTSFVKKMIPLMMLMFIGTSGIIYWQMNDNQQKQNIPVVNSEEIDNKMEKDLTPETNIAYDEDQQIQENNKPAQRSNSYLASLDDKTTDNNGVKAEQFVANDNLNNIELKQIEMTNGFNSNFIPEFTGKPNSFGLIGLNNDNNFSSYWYAQALGIFAGSMASNNLPTQSSALYSNINFGLFRQISNDISLGIQFGMEPYDIYQTDNQDLPYLSSKNILWVTAAARYDMNFASVYGINPYLSIAAGGSTVGFMTRGMFGLNYNFERLPLGITLGYEASMINYSIYKAYSSTKNGVTAGFNIRF